MPTRGVSRRFHAWLARIEWVRFTGVVVQVGLCALVVWTYELQSKAFLKITLLTFGGFAVHHLLPLGLRMPFFAALSLAGIGWVLGVANALWLLGLGLALIALCHVPAPFWARIATLGAVALALAACRAGWLPVAVPPAVWPILGSMFMFRIVVYLYDMRTRAAPFGIWRSLAYFFMLPNVCFPLFPVVDYKSFCRSHYSASAVEVYQKGVHWILRGITHLLCYRVVKQHLLIDPFEVQSASELAQSLVANFLLYLRISGDFHLIAGTLHLFGFNVSETNHLYVLSSGISEFWRRINTYWREFMEKLLFRPIFFRARRYGQTPALLAATACVFLATWLLHSYQWFWIRGDFPLAWQDGAFWLLLGACMVASVVREAKQPRSRSLGTPARRWRSEVSRALRVVGTFAFIVTVWSLWTAESWQEWTEMMSRARVFSLRDAVIIGLGAAILGLGAVLLGGSTVERPGHRAGASTPARGAFWRSAASVGAIGATLLVLGASPRAAGWLPGSAAYVEDLKANRLSVRDARSLERGYYEGLTNVRRLDDELASLFLRPLGWNKQKVSRDTGGFPRSENIPGYRGRFNGEAWSTNRWGMRDQDYALAKPAGTLRIGLFGASHTVGVGVADGQTYESLVEERLNRDPPEGAPLRRYEILNFSVGGYGPYERLEAIRRRTEDFDLDLVLYVVVNDLDWMVRDVVDARTRGLDLPDPYVVSVCDRAKIATGTPAGVATHRLAPHAAELIAWVYRELAAFGRERGIRVFALLEPKPETETEWRREVPITRSLLGEAALPILDLTDAYDRVDEWEQLWAEPWDKHPNARGHRLLAERLYPALAPHLLNERSARGNESRAGSPRPEGARDPAATR
jgi:lysophospholipase L1-like esterase